MVVFLLPRRPPLVQVEVRLGLTVDVVTLALGEGDEEEGTMTGDHTMTEGRVGEFHRASGDVAKPRQSVSLAMAEEGETQVAQRTTAGMGVAGEDGELMRAITKRLCRHSKFYGTPAYYWEMMTVRGLSGFGAPARLVSRVSIASTKRNVCHEHDQLGHLRDLALAIGAQR